MEEIIMNTTYNQAAYLLNNRNISTQVLKKKKLKKNVYLNNKAKFNVLCVSVLVMLIIICSGIMIANAGVSDDVKIEQYKYYTSISIEKGDTLWSIADNYVDGTDSINQYVNDLKEINHLQNDCIYQGQNLIVYYYSTAQK
jgi:hypothetical protein